MGLIICHHEGRYNLYSTISDGFVYSKSLSPKQLEIAVKQRSGDDGLAALPGRLERANKSGHSSHESGSLENFLCCNRAGKNEAHLSYEECIKGFLS